MVTFTNTFREQMHVSGRATSDNGSERQLTPLCLIRDFDSVVRTTGDRIHTSSMQLA